MRWKTFWKTSHARLGLVVSDTCLAWARLDITHKGPSLSGYDFLHDKDAHALWERFRATVNAQGLQGLPVHVVLAASEYQLLLMESPAVPLDELREAVRWRLTDLIAFPVTEAVVDAFALPADAYRGHQPMVYAAVCHQTRVNEARTRTESLKLRLASVTTLEIALCQLERHMPLDGESTALVELNENKGLIAVFQHHALYLARQLPFGFHDLADPARYDSVLLEIQRSMDYYDSQIGKGLIKRILLTPFPGAEALSQHLASNLDVSVSMTDLSAVLPADAQNDARLAACLPAIGAALRAE